MSIPLHETLRALGQGMVAGSAIVAAIGIIFFFLGPVGMVAIGLAAGPALITVANALKRRDQRKAKDWS